MKQVCLIQASPHVGGVCDTIMRLLQMGSTRPDVVLHTYFLREYTLKPCLGCRSCAKAPHQCVHRYIQDDANKLLSIMQAADLVLLCAPIYFYALPGPCKTLIDRAQSFWEAQKTNPKDTLKPTTVLLTAGRSTGQELFRGSLLTLKYFFASLGREISETFNLSGLELRDDLLQNQKLCDQLRTYLTTVSYI